MSKYLGDRLELSKNVYTLVHIFVTNVYGIYCAYILFIHRASEKITKSKTNDNTGSLRIVFLGGSTDEITSHFPN